MYFKPSNLALASLALSMFLSSIGVSIPNVALPTLAKVFSAPLAGVQWVILAYLLAVTTSIVGIGHLGDEIGRRRGLLVGIALFSASAILCGISPTLWFLIAARALQGLGAASLMALTLALVSEAVPKAKLGRAMGLLGTVSALGTAAGPSLGGLLIASLGWRSVFFLMALLGTLALYFISRSLPKTEPKSLPRLRHFDLLGTLYLGISLASYALTATIGGGHLSRVNLWLLLAMVASGSLFVWHENRVRSPLIRREALRESNIVVNLVMNAVVSSIMMSTLVVGPFYLSRGLGLSAAAVGLAMSVGPVTSSLSGVIAGRIVDRLGASAVMIIGLSQLGVGALAMSLFAPAMGLTGYVISCILLSPGYQMFQAANNTSLMSKVSSTQHGVVSGMLSLSRNLGLITGTSVMGTVFSLAAGSPQIAVMSSEAATTGMRAAFLLSATFALVALIARLTFLRSSLS